MSSRYTNSCTITHGTTTRITTPTNAFHASILADMHAHTQCMDVEQTRVAFDKINGAINGLGLVNEGVLVQGNSVEARHLFIPHPITHSLSRTSEFLDGTEYVVDSVSRDGIHKVCAIWEYDKVSLHRLYTAPPHFICVIPHPLAPTPSDLSIMLISCTSA